MRSAADGSNTRVLHYYYLLLNTPTRISVDVKTRRHSGSLPRCLFLSYEIKPCFERGNTSRVNDFFASKKRFSTPARTATFASELRRKRPFFSNARPLERGARRAQIRLFRASKNRAQRVSFRSVSFWAPLENETTRLLERWRNGRVRVVFAVLSPRFWSARLRGQTRGVSTPDVSRGPTNVTGRRGTVTPPTPRCSTAYREGRRIFALKLHSFR